MELLKISLLIMLVYLCIYGVTNRICRCFEHCATAKSYEKFVENAEKTRENLSKNDKKEEK